MLEPGKVSWTQLVHKHALLCASGKCSNVCMSAYAIPVSLHYCKLSSHASFRKSRFLACVYFEWQMEETTLGQTRSKRMPPAFPGTRYPETVFLGRFNFSQQLCGFCESLLGLALTTTHVISYARKESGTDLAEHVESSSSCALCQYATAASSPQQTTHEEASREGRVSEATWAPSHWGLTFWL